MKTSDDILIEAGETFRQRRAVYGDNWKRAGAMLQALFPNGVFLSSAMDHDSFHILSLIVVKLSRYAVSWDRGEFHQDSVHDAAVYCAMLEMIDGRPERIKDRATLRKLVEKVKHDLNRNRPQLRRHRRRPHRKAKSHKP